MASDNLIKSGILGDIRPKEDALNDHSAHRPTVGGEDIESMEGGSQHDACAPYAANA